MNPFFVFPASVLCLTLVLFVYDTSGLEGAHQLNYPPSAMLPLVPRFPSYEEFLEPTAGSAAESGLTPLLSDPRVSANNMMLAGGGDFGEEGCAHLNGMHCDGKMETMVH